MPPEFLPPPNRLGRILALSRCAMRFLNVRTGDVIVLGSLPALSQLQEGGSFLKWEEWLRLIHPDDRSDYEARMEACKARGSNYDLSYRLGRPDSPIHVRERGVVYQDRSASPVEVLALIGDVSEVVRLENRLALARKMEAFGQLAGGVAHDFNNMLSIILGYTQILLDELGEHDPRRQFLKEIDDAARRASSLTNQLLAFTRQEIYGKQRVTFDNLLADMAKMLRRMVGEQVELKIEAQAGADGVVLADRNQLEQLLIHLSVCARDLLPRGGFFTFRSMIHQPDGETPPVLALVAECRENQLSGQNILPGQVVGWTEELPALDTCEAIAKENNAKLVPSGHSAAPESLVVEFTLTRRRPPAEHRAGKLLPTTRGKKVLLVEDDPGVRTLGRVVFSRAGFEVIEAANGQAGLRAFQNCRDEKLAAIVTDVIMPGLNGIEMARQILAEDPGVPVLFLSGYPDQLHRLADPPLPGRHALLRKPCPVSEIFAKVQELMQEGES